MRILHCKRGHSALLLKYLVMTFALHGIGAAAVRASTPKTLQQGIRFEQNLGQLGSEVKFYARGSGGTLTLTEHEAILTFRYRKAESASARSSQVRTRAEVDTLHMLFMGANPNPEIKGIGQLSGTSSYFGKDAQHTHTGIPAFSAVEYKDIYPGIDLWFLNKNGVLQVAYNLKPHADIHMIRFAFSGALADTVQGDLRIRLSHGDSTHQASARDMATGGTRRVQFTSLPNQQFALDISGQDSSQGVLISPVLSFAGTINGLGDTDGYGIAVDASGNSYLAGETGRTTPVS